MSGGTPAERLAEAIEAAQLREGVDWLREYDLLHQSCQSLVRERDELREALRQIASCERHAPSDVVDVARAALAASRDGRTASPATPHGRDGDDA